MGLSRLHFSSLDFAKYRIFHGQILFSTRGVAWPSSGLHWRTRDQPHCSSAPWVELIFLVSKSPLSTSVDCCVWVCLPRQTLAAVSECAPPRILTRLNWASRCAVYGFHWSWKVSPKAIFLHICLTGSYSLPQTLGFILPQFFLLIPTGPPSSSQPCLSHLRQSSCKELALQVRMLRLWIPMWIFTFDFAVESFAV